MSAIPPLSEDKPTSGGRIATAAFDPLLKWLAAQASKRRQIIRRRLEQPRR
jgi:hypothetical protein